MTDKPMTRREARELERLRELEAKGYPVTTGSLPVLPESVEAEAEAVAEVAFDDAPPITGQSSVLEPKALVVEDPAPDLNNMSVVLPESGAVLTTGAIELPWLKSVDTDTTQVVYAAETADEAKSAEVEESVVSGIEPIPARIHERTRRKASVFPNRLRRGWGVVHLVLVSSFIIFALLCALIASILLGVIKF
ncbi:MAG: hypothetical protein RJA35_645 [Actinomycetota bacterium]|jgi:hypothetical protein